MQDPHIYCAFLPLPASSETYLIANLTSGNMSYKNTFLRAGSDFLQNMKFYVNGAEFKDIQWKVNRN